MAKINKRSAAYVLNLPKTYQAEPWHLVEVSPNDFKLAYITKGYGGGIVPGQALGGRGIIIVTEGMADLHPKEVEFRQDQMIYAWRIRPSQDRIEKAIERHANGDAYSCKRF